VRDGEHISYRLRVKKQPGTVAHPITIRVHIPHGLTVESVTPQALLEGEHLFLETDLRTDLVLNVSFLEE
jgi:hypothetical protein